jgi:hypothetical protein
MFADDKSVQEPVKKVKESKPAEVVKTKEPRKKIEIKKPQNMVLFVILCLLILQVLMTGYQTFLNIQDQVQQARLIASVQKYTSTTDQVVNQLLTDYKSEVYNNANVNSTAKQQVMARNTISWPSCWWRNKTAASWKCFHN